MTEPSPDSLRLSWTVSEGHFDSFVVQFKDRDGLRTVPVEGHKHSVTITPLDSGRTYRFLLYGLLGKRRHGPLSVEGTTGEASVSALVAGRCLAPSGCCHPPCHLVPAAEAGTSPAFSWPQPMAPALCHSALAEPVSRPLNHALGGRPAFPLYLPFRGAERCEQCWNKASPKTPSGSRAAGDQRDTGLRGPHMDRPRGPV